VTSQVRTISDRLGEYSTQTVVVLAGSGEVNRLELAPVERQGVRVHDPAGLTALAPCVAQDPATVVCPPLGSLALEVALGDGDDTLTSTFGADTYLNTVRVDGGAGDDVLAMAGADLVGGAGDDRLTGRSVEGGPGADVLAGERLSYADHTEGVRVDLAGDTAAGAPGEGDQVAPGFTTVTGGAGPDTLIAADRAVSASGGEGDDVLEGSPGEDRLEGEAGDDVVRGHGGDDDLRGDGLDVAEGDDRLEGGDGDDHLTGSGGRDVLDGGTGRDALAGDAGADVLLARDGEADSVFCDGSVGAPQTLQGDRATLDPLDADEWCAHVDRSGPPRLEVHGWQRVGAHGLRLVVSCPARRACTGTLRLRGEGSPVRLGRISTRRAFRVAAGRRARLSLPQGRRVDTRAFDYRVTVRTGGRTLRASLGVP
jgi:Ca2+-binding RTX toxin-like protein